jgi:hypothetical protein
VAGNVCRRAAERIAAPARLHAHGLPVQRMIAGSRSRRIYTVLMHVPKDGSALPIVLFCLYQLLAWFALSLEILLHADSSIYSGSECTLTATSDTRT